MASSSDRPSLTRLCRSLHVLKINFLSLKTVPGVASRQLKIRHISGLKFFSKILWKLISLASHAKRMYQISLLKKIITCFLAGLIAAITIQRIIYRSIWEFKNKLILPPVFAIAFIVILLLIALICAFNWHFKERKEQTANKNNLAFWQAVMRYFIAIDLSMIGWQKLFHLQFYTPLGILDQPFSTFSGEALTWAYFGHSYAFTCVVGLFQIAGSYLLLFKRTSIFACFILFPVLLNIVCIDFFYHFEIGELAHAAILLIGILYLLLQEYERLVEFFFLAKNNLPSVHFKNRFTRNITKLSVVLIPLLLILSYGSHDKNPKLTGKYSVQSLLVNQKPVIVNSCQDSVLTTIYFDREDDIVFEFNSQQRRWIGSYNFNQTNDSITASWRFPLTAKNALRARLVGRGNNSITLSGIIGDEKIEVILVKDK